jgi:phosphohistidine swiveling domain-containing protein
VTYVIRPGESDDRRELGGKAWRLNALRHSGLPIPEWFVVSPRAFSASLAPAERASLGNQATDLGASAQSAVADLQIARDVALEVSEALRALCPEGQRVAVRSSADEEDGARRSCAGQLNSFLFVAVDEVLDRLALVWTSAFSERFVAYRRATGLSLPRCAPAVLIQRMVDADAAGVAFGADPMSAGQDVAVISAVYGLGSSLVSGECDADTFRVSRGGDIVEREIAVKRVAHRAAAGGGRGWRAADVPESLVTQPVLDDGRVRQVACLVRAAERHFGEPQDVEWAFERGCLYLLQSRPITTPGRDANPDGVLNLWDNSNIAESYSGITTPLTFSFARHVYEEVYRQFCRLVRVPDSVIDAHDDTFRHMLGLIRGRVYYNLLSWYRLLATLPGFRVNRRFMEQMMGVAEGVPDDFLQNPGEPTTTARFVDGFRLANTTLGLVVNHVLLPRRIDRFGRRLNHALDPATELVDLRTDELVAYYRQLEWQLLKRWDAPLVNDFFAMIFYGVLRRLTTAWCGDANGTLQNDLIGADGGMISAEPARCMREMAACAAADRDLSSVLVDGEMPAIEAAIARNLKFKALYEQYLAKFGDRCLEELKLESRTLAEDPAMLLRAVGQLAQPLQSSTTAVDAAGHAADRHARHESVRTEAERRVMQALKGRPDRRIVFNWVLKHARKHVRDRENMRFERTRVFGRVRRIFVALGRQFAALGVLEAAEDIFFLQIDEAFGFVDGTGVSTDLKGLVKLRRAEYAGYLEVHAPAHRFQTRGIVSLYGGFRATDTAESLVAGERKGTGCCAGVVEGPVRVVLDPRRTVVRPGDVLVAERTDPGWVVLFSAAAGVLVEYGSVLSHSAIIAREMAIPTIVAIPGVTRWLRDGDRVRLDGRSGVVRKVEDSEGASHAS